MTTFHPDDFGPESALASDSQLINIIQENNAEYLIMIYHNDARWRREFIGFEALKLLDKRGVKIICIWGDIHSPAQRQLIRRLGPVVRLHIVTASETIARRLGTKFNIIYSHVPVSDKTVSPCGCGAMVSFAGTLKPERKRVIGKLIHAGIPVHTSGGEGNAVLSREEYLRILSHPIALSFQDGGGLETIMNARPYEIANQNVLMLEQWGRETAKVFSPFLEYIPWKSASDLIESIQQFSTDTVLRQRIAEMAKKRSSEFTDAGIWKLVIEQAGSLDSRFSSTMTLHKVKKISGAQPRLTPIIDRMLSNYKVELPITFADHILRLLKNLLYAVGQSLANPQFVIQKVKDAKCLK